MCCAEEGLFAVKIYDGTGESVCSGDAMGGASVFPVLRRRNEWCADIEGGQTARK